MEPLTDWAEWHSAYADPSSLLSQRLRLVQGHIRDYLDETAPAPVTILSSCAGDGRDLLEVLEARNDSNRVAATLIEADTRNAGRARQRRDRLGLSNIEIRCEDAGAGRAYLGAVPADLVLLC